MDECLLQSEFLFHQRSDIDNGAALVENQAGIEGEDEGESALGAYSLDGFVDAGLDGSNELFLLTLEVLGCGLAELFNGSLLVLYFLHAAFLDGLRLSLIHI